MNVRSPVLHLLAGKLKFDKFTPRLRPLNTLDTPIRRPGFGNPSLNSNPLHRQSSRSGSENFTRGSKLGHSVRDGNDEPQQKRQKLEATRIRDDDAVSPFFSSPGSQTMIITRSGTPISGDVQLSPTIINSHHPSTSVSEYQDGERIVRPAPISRTSSQTADHPFPKPSTNGHIQQPNEIDSEDFLRISDLERHREDNSRRSGSSPEAQAPEKGPVTREPTTNKSAIIDSIFPQTYSPDPVPSLSAEKSECQHLLTSATQNSRGRDEASESASTRQFPAKRAPSKRSKGRTSDPTSACGKQVAGSVERRDASSPVFPLRNLLYGYLPLELSYSASIHGATLEILNSESLLSEEPLWTVPLLKILKVSCAADDCSKLILYFSNMENQLSNKAYLDFRSQAARDDFLSLALAANTRLLVEIKDGK